VSQFYDIAIEADIDLRLMAEREDRAMLKQDAAPVPVTTVGQSPPESSYAEYIGRNSAKFYRVSVVFEAPSWVAVFEWGRIGSPPQDVRRVPCSDFMDARQVAADQFMSKIDKGYVEKPDPKGRLLGPRAIPRALPRFISPGPQPPLSVRRRGVQPPFRKPSTMEEPKVTPRRQFHFDDE